MKFPRTNFIEFCINFFLLQSQVVVVAATAVVAAPVVVADCCRMGLIWKRWRLLNFVLLCTVQEKSLRSHIACAVDIFICVCVCVSVCECVLNGCWLVVYVAAVLYLLVDIFNVKVVLGQECLLWCCAPQPLGVSLCACVCQCVCVGVVTNFHIYKFLANFKPFSIMQLQLSKSLIACHFAESSEGAATKMRWENYNKTNARKRKNC